MAGLGRRTFAAGEVLTAGNVMGYLQDQAVMNFAGTAARGSAIGTAVSEGMVSYLADSNVVQAYDGSAWNSLAYATAVPTLAQTGLRTVIPTSVTVGSGSGSIDTTTGVVTFSGANNLFIDGAFTSAYRNYRVVGSGITASTAAQIDAQFRAGGTTKSGNYYFTAAAYQLASGSSGIYTGFNGISFTEILPATTEQGWSHFVWDIFMPAVSSTQTASVFQSTGYSVAIQNRNGAIMYNFSEALDGFRLFPNVTSNLGGQIKIYGYN